MSIFGKAVMTTGNSTPRPPGAVLHSPLLYDALLWLLLRGGERRWRQRLIELAGLRAGESVLDVGCGTGTLAILAKTLGSARTVWGIDASQEMVARARAKAARAGVDVRFEIGSGQALPFADCAFDLALSTIMLHHLGRAARRELAAELRRVVRPGGRVLVVDFAKAPANRRRLARHFRHGHGHVDSAEVVELLEGAGFVRVQTGAVGVKSLHYALATAPPGVEEDVSPRNFGSEASGAPSRLPERGGPPAASAAARRS
jgi:SAM-dependent methyltransferase